MTVGVLMFDGVEWLVGILDKGRLSFLSSGSCAVMATLVTAAELEEVDIQRGRERRVCTAQERVGEG